MIIKHTRDTLSETYLDAVAIRNTIFVKGQGVPRSIEIDANEALDDDYDDINLEDSFIIGEEDDLDN